jgi:enamine deaminase RidA (YjgF/YER057c/UK114 family)
MDKNSVVIPPEMKAMYDNFHFAPAIKDGDRLFCSGVIGIGPDGKASGDPETQFKQAFESLKSVLTAGGASISDVVDITTFHVGLQANLRAFMKVKDQYVTAPYPAWTAIGISELAFPGGLVEIKAVARLKK